MAKRDYYEVLGLKPGAFAQDIKSAFRRAAKDCHPDVCPGDKNAEREFKELNEAYETLKDPQKRTAYDKFGHAAFEFGGGSSSGRSAHAPSYTASAETIDGLLSELYQRKQDQSTEAFWLGSNPAILRKIAELLRTVPFGQEHEIAEKFFLDKNGHPNEIFARVQTQLSHQ